eukprot:355855_1
MIFFFFFNHIQSVFIMALKPQNQHTGYFMLIFHPQSGMKQVVWNKYSAILGRSDTKGSKLNENFLGIGTYKTISREHGELKWNSLKKCWDLRVLGKRGVCSNTHKIEKGKIVSLPMDRPTPLKMGESKFYFCPAQIINQS